MLTGKIFMNGQSQAVRLPKECRFDEKEVLVKKIGHMVILAPKNRVWEIFEEGLNKFPDDFLKSYEKLPIQEREGLK